MNQDGKTTTITSPSADAQVKLIRDCYERAGMELSQTGYVEAHMTGTAAGDPIEADAIARTFGQSRDAHDPVIVGSVKTNLGHTEPVSGLAALIKTSFALKHRVIPQNLNYLTTNPEIHMDEWHLKVPTALTPWPEDKLVRASVNNFGYGGTNAHAILEPAPSQSSRGRVLSDGHASGLSQNGGSNRTTANGRQTNDDGELQTNGHKQDYVNANGNIHAEVHPSNTKHESYVFVLSAKDSVACQSTVQRLIAHLDRNDHLVPADLAYTLSERRSLHPWVITVRAGSTDELVKRLCDPTVKPVSVSRIPRLGFVFNGQGAQWHAMARELIEAYPSFQKDIADADRILKDFGADWSLQEELMRDKSRTRVDAINLSQPMTVAIQLCLVNLLRFWGIRPAAVTSHSSGEIAAAYATNVLTYQDALGVAYFRGDLTLKHQILHALKGGMLAAALSPASAEQYIVTHAEGEVVVACINSPDSVTLSGEISALERLNIALEADGVFSRMLKVPMAYHSKHMDSIAQEYVERLEAFLPPSAKRWDEDSAIFVSPVTGQEVTSPVILDAQHWAQNMTHPVLFSEAFEAMSGKVDMIVEIGAHSTLAGPIRQILKARNATLPYTSCLKRNTDAVTTMQDVACELLSRSYPVRLQDVNFPKSQTSQNFLTNLPAYPWNHSKRYWVEPRISREQRYKKFSPHELLGTPLNGSNGLTPTWRNILRLEELEWLRDHQIDGSVVFPGAGYISMAVEAARLLVDPSEDTILSYRLRDIDIINAMIVPDSAFGVEVQTTLRPCSDKEFDHEGWYSFELSSLAQGGSWIEHCKGYVSAEVSNAASKARTNEMSRAMAPPAESAYLTQPEPVDVESLFAGLRSRGMYHGPEFQNLIDGHASGNRAVTNFLISPGACNQHDYVLHPTTLDSIMQASFSSLPKDIDTDTMVLPRFIRTLTIPRTFNRLPGEKLKAFSESVKADNKGFTSSIAVTGAAADENSTVACLRLQDFFGQAVPRRAEETGDDAGLCSKNVWELDILHDFPAELKSSLAIPLMDHEVETEKKLVRASYNFFFDCVKELSDQSQDDWEWHHKRFFAWIEDIVARGEAGTLAPGSQTWSKTSKGVKSALADELNAGNAAGRLTVRVGRNLTRIVRGEVMPLELMMEGNLLNQFYMDHEALKTRSYKHLATIAELYATKNPGANVIEIGGGTGGATTTVLEGFGARGDGLGTILGRYMFTDVSPGFFEAARSKFAPWSSLMDYKKLDIEIDPVEQGFVPGTYDLVVAASCLHATKSLIKTMSHVRSLLKPGGTLLLIEATADRLEGQLIFGTLPGWWLGEEPERQTSPNAPLDMWQRVLKETGFTGVDFDIPDYEEPDFQSARVMLARATTSVKGPITIIKPSHEDASSSSWITQLAKAVSTQLGITPSICNLDDKTIYQDTLCIATMEMERAFVNEMTTTEFEDLRQLFLNSNGLLWLSHGGAVDSTEPAYGATDGLMRTMRQEDAGKRWIKLDLDRQTGSLWATDDLAHVMHVLQQSFDATLDPTQVEWEYAVKNGQLRVPRTWPDKAQDALAQSLDVEPLPELQLFDQPGRPLVWETPRVNASSIDPYFVDNQEIVSTPVPKGQVEIEAKAFGLNFREVMVALGQLDEPLKGHECSGVITALGPETAESGLKVGDKVCALVKGRIASRGRTWWTSVAKLPDGFDLSWESAASFPAAYVTAYGSLVQIANLRKGESVLVHAAAGGTGQAAIIIAQTIGAEVFATCSTTAKRDLLIQQYGLDVDHIFSSRDVSFAPALMSKTNGKGVDVVLNSLSGPLLKATWDCVARFGRFVDITKVDIEFNRLLETSPFSRCATFTSFDLMQLTEYCGKLTQDALQQSVAIVHQRGAESSPIHPIAPFSISDMALAMRQMQGGQHVGKLVLVPHDGDKVKVVTRLAPMKLDRDDATYLISGGLGGIGRAIAEWMIGKEAKNVVLVSRNATLHRAAGSLQEAAQKTGCRLVIQDCDVSDSQSLQHLIQECSSLGLPPIRGVVNGAMVLNDTVMERMTYEQWTNGVRPKIESSRNIHNHIPQLDFYVMLSSVAGVAGHMSQANYAAGNTFQDAMARHRTVRGQPAVTIDLGAVRSVGYVADREAGGDERLRARVENVGFGSVDLDAVLGIVEAAIRDPLRSTPDDSQVIVGPNFHAFAGDSAMKHDRRFGTLRIASQQNLQSGAAKDPASSSKAALLQALAASNTLEEATAVLVDAMGHKLAFIFSIPLSDIDPELPITRYGVDSLVAVELRNWVSTTVKAKVSVFEILQSASLTEFAALASSKSELLATKEFANASAGETAA